MIQALGQTSVGISGGQQLISNLDAAVVIFLCFRLETVIYCTNQRTGTSSYTNGRLLLLLLLLLLV